MRFFSWLITLPLLLAILVFVLGNREPVNLSLWPFDVQVTMPLALLTLGVLFAGMMIGGFFVWMGSLGLRFEACRLKRHAHQLEEQLHAEQMKPKQEESPATSRRRLTLRLPWKRSNP